MTYKCPFSPNVSCHNMECRTCGWNPVVATQRLEKIKAELGVNEDGEGKPSDPNKWVYG